MFFAMFWGNGKRAVNSRGRAIRNIIFLPAALIAGIIGAGAPAFAAEDQGSIAVVSENFTPPRPGPAHRPPDYPRIPQMLGQQGNALFKVCVAANGTKSEIALIQSSGSDLLDRAARGYLEDDVTYQPALQDGAAVEYCRNEAVVWELPAEDGAAPEARPNQVTLRDYPPESIEANEQGRVVVNICVGADGIVDEVRLVESAGFARLDNATIIMVTAHYRYSPMMQNGVPVRSCYDQPVTWGLQR